MAPKPKQPNGPADQLSKVEILDQAFHATLAVIDDIEGIEARLMSLRACISDADKADVDVKILATTLDAAAGGLRCISGFMCDIAASAGQFARRHRNELRKEE